MCLYSTIKRAAELNSNCLIDNNENIKSSKNPRAATPVSSPLPMCDQDLPFDSIKTEYHPSSGRATRIERFEDYREHDAAAADPPHTSEPWRPFCTRTDFEFAEVALEACLNKRQVEKLIQIIYRCKSGEDEFTITNHKHLCETWTQASALLTPVSNFTFFLPVFSNLNLYPDP